MHFLDQGQGTLLIDDCCNAISFKQVVGGLELQHSSSFFEKKKKKRFFTRAKEVVTLLYHRAQNNWNTDKKTQSLVYETREGCIFGFRKKNPTYSEDAVENKRLLDCEEKARLRESDIRSYL